MSWRAPTTADFESAILQDERIAWSTASADPATDTTAKAIADATGRFRSALRAGYKGTMGVAGTLPADLITSAMHVAVFYFLGGRGGAQVSEDRRTLYKDAIRLAERIEDGRVAYTDPDDVEDVAAPSQAAASPVFIARTRSLTRDSQKGL
jgi:phage gp36-like protein